MAEHAILRLDNVQATQDNSLMRSGLFYTVSGNTKTPTDIDNGLPVNVGALVPALLHTISFKNIYENESAVS